MIDLGHLELDHLVRVRLGHPLRVDRPGLVEPLVDDPLDQGRGLDALAPLLQDDRVGDLLHHPAAPQDAARPQVVRLGGRAGHDRPAGVGQDLAFERLPLGQADLPEVGPDQDPAGQARRGARLRDLDLDVERVLRADPGRDLRPDQDQGEPLREQELVRRGHVGLAHLLQELVPEVARLGVGAGPVELGDEADPLDLELRAVDDVGEVADRLLLLEDRLGFLLGRPGRDQGHGDRPDPQRPAAQTDTLPHLASLLAFGGNPRAGPPKRNDGGGDRPLTLPPGHFLVARPTLAARRRREGPRDGPKAAELYDSPPNRSTSKSSGRPAPASYPPRRRSTGRRTVGLSPGGIPLGSSQIPVVADVRELGRFSVGMFRHFRSA